MPRPGPAGRASRRHKKGPLRCAGPPLLLAGRRPEPAVPRTAPPALDPSAICPQPLRHGAPRRRIMRHGGTTSKRPAGDLGQRAEVPETSPAKSSGAPLRPIPSSSVDPSPGRAPAGRQRYRRTVRPACHYASCRRTSIRPCLSVPGAARRQRLQVLHLLACFRSAGPSVGSFWRDWLPADRSASCRSDARAGIGWRETRRLSGGVVRGSGRLCRGFPGRELAVCFRRVGDRHSHHGPAGRSRLLLLLQAHAQRLAVAHVLARIDNYRSRD
jgi:hypothetical protein